MTTTNAVALSAETYCHIMVGTAGFEPTRYLSTKGATLASAFSPSYPKINHSSLYDTAKRLTQILFKDII